MSVIAVPTPLAHAPPPSQAGPRPWRWTREQYLKLDALGFFGEKRVELIRGEIIEMPRPSWSHVVGTTKAAAVLRQVFAGTGWVNEQNPLPTPDSDPLPDVAVYPGRIEDYSDYPTVSLLVVEVAESSLTYDITTKAELYAEAGHADYWVIDLENRRLLVFRDPEPLPAGLGATAYRTRDTFGPADTVAPLAAPASPVRVADLLP
jgi:Uma2 family endonuclease